MYRSRQAVPARPACLVHPEVRCFLVAGARRATYSTLRGRSPGSAAVVEVQH